MHHVIGLSSDGQLLIVYCHHFMPCSFINQTTEIHENNQNKRRKREKKERRKSEMQYINYLYTSQL